MRSEVILAFFISWCYDFSLLKKKEGSVLKIMRRGAIENPWFFRTIMFTLAVAFMITMGWWGFGNDEDRAIAKVDQTAISIDEYQQAYQNATNFYREIFQDKYDDKELRKRVIQELVERQLWLKEARLMKLLVSDQELKESITKMAGFQKDGKFDSELYKRLLAFEHFTPESFERRQREDLLVAKTKNVVKDAVALTPPEIEEAKASNPSNPDPDRVVSDLLFQKKQRALAAYTLSLKREASIHIKEELL